MKQQPENGNPTHDGPVEKGNNFKNLLLFKIHPEDSNHKISVNIQSLSLRERSSDTVFS